MYYLVTYYGDLTDAEFILKIKEIIQKMTGNDTFKDLSEQVAKIKSMNDILENLIVVAFSGTRQDRTNRDT
ncbi:hypothetical protein [Sphingobacterium hungaricum]|uniref:Uncharacterized protein n=1 Tax=Sphingobacterium hungaricum TaxID=2082723 RepID=A0A928UWG4_9SPHI|nr:hypothetical protein [Sphingobacterium hungaricum]MBE8712374.1 hypothetical protein [Sphingobacterium hungaricum]